MRAGAGSADDLLDKLPDLGSDELTTIMSKRLEIDEAEVHCRALRFCAWSLKSVGSGLR